jgi:protoporphyrinogen oxidase
METNIENYDYIIVGGGPTGMTLSWILSSYGKKVLLVEKENSLGGCHRVQRVDGYFSEHGPRVYSDSYLYFIDILNDMGLDFKELFTLYKFNLSNIDNQTIFSLSKTEKFSLLKAFILMSFDINYGKKKSIKQFMVEHNFKPNSIDYIERLCRLTDGASADDYTLFQFLQLLNQQYFYEIYQPRKPNDKGLMKLWTDKLIENKVKILLNNEVVKIDRVNNAISDIIIVNNGVQKRIKVNKLILSVPPKPFYNIISSSLEIQDSFGDLNKLKKWKSKNSYFDYIPLTFHYNSKDIKLPKKNGFPRTPWGIGFIILSDFMNFENEPSKQCISICISMTDVPNESGKTANECTIDEIIKY